MSASQAAANALGISAEPEPTVSTVLQNPVDRDGPVQISESARPDHQPVAHNANRRPLLREGHAAAFVRKVLSRHTAIVDELAPLKITIWGRETSTHRGKIAVGSCCPDTGTTGNRLIVSQKLLVSGQMSAKPMPDNVSCTVYFGDDERLAIGWIPLSYQLECKGKCPPHLIIEPKHFDDYAWVLPDIPRDEPDVIIPLKLLLDNCMLRTKLVHRMARKLELFLLGDPEVGPPVAKDKPTHYEIKSLITEYRMPLPKPATDEESMRARAESSQLRIASRQSRLPLQPTNPTTDTTAANPPFNPPPPAPTWTETPQYQQYQYPQQHQLQNQYQYQQHAQPQPNGQSYNPALRQSLPSHASGLSHENTSIQPIQAGTHPINTLPAGSHHPHSSLPLSADPSLLSPSAYPPQPPQPPQRPSSLLSRSSPPQTLQVSSSSRSPRRSRGLLSEFIR